jgi:hypothetical protein
MELFGYLILRTSALIGFIIEYIFIHYKCVECADRELLPSFHEVSVYPKKELPFFILFTAGLCSFTALLALLTHQYPDSMGVSQLKRLFFHTYLTTREMDFIYDKPTT